MYEPIILQKQKPRRLGGTPAGRAYLVIKFIKTLIATTVGLSISVFVVKKRKIIQELDEPLKPTQEQIAFEDYWESRHFWSLPQFSFVTAEVMKRNQKQLDPSESVENDKSNAVSDKQMTH